MEKLRHRVIKMHHVNVHLIKQCLGEKSKSPDSQDKILFSLDSCPGLKH